MCLAQTPLRPRLRPAKAGALRRGHGQGGAPRLGAVRRGQARSSAGVASGRSEAYSNIRAFRFPADSISAPRATARSIPPRFMSVEAGIVIRPTSVVWLIALPFALAAATAALAAS